MPRVDLLQFRAGPSSTWTSVNPVLDLGEPGLETDTNKVKYGDGSTAWNSLAYPAGGGTSPFKGVYATSGALAAAHPTADPGDYAYVDAGVGSDVEIWMWDDDDADWIQGGTGGSSPPADASTPGIMKLYVGTGANGDGTITQAAITAALALKLNLAGGTLSGNLALGGNKITGSAAASANGELVRYEQLVAFSAAVDVTGVAIQFDSPKIYNAPPATPGIGNVTLNATGLVKGMVQILYHNDASEPSWPSEFVRLRGDYVPSALNVIYMNAISATRIEYVVL